MATQQQAKPKGLKKKSLGSARARLNLPAKAGRRKPRPSGLEKWHTTPEQRGKRTPEKAFIASKDSDEIEYRSRVERRQRMKPAEYSIAKHRAQHAARRAANTGVNRSDPFFYSRAMSRFHNCIIDEQDAEASRFE